MKNKGFIFVSYSRDDIEFVKEIVSALEKQGINIYIDYKDIPPGAIFAEEIVSAIENSICCVLMFTESSNKSGYVLSEMNSAINHNKPIIPLRIGETMPSKALEFYIGKNNWVEYNDAKSLESLIQSINTFHTSAEENKEIKNKGPIVLRSDQLTELGYSIEKQVVETIEIDYLTLNAAKEDYIINEETEGTVPEWVEFSNSYPETSSMLIVDDRIVGYSLIELINESNYRELVSGQKMIKSTMAEFYGLGGDFYCYIGMMPIIREYETQKNYLLLLNDLLNKMVEFAKEGVNIVQYAISVYSPLLEAMMKTLGFEVVAKNPASGKIMVLTREKIISSSVFRDRYPEFYKLYAEK